MKSFEASTATLNTYLFKNRHQLGLSFVYETDYSATFESNEYFFIEIFGAPPPPGSGPLAQVNQKIHIYLKRENGTPGEKVNNSGRVLNLLRLEI